MKIEKRIIIFSFALASLVVIGISFALAESNFPTRPIELVICYSAGGGSDLIQASFKEKVSRILGQPVVPVYKTGAGGAVGASYVAKSKPDGYTIAVFTNSMYFIALTQKDAGYSPEDFTPICNLTLTPIYLAIRDDSPYKTLQDFIQAAKTKRMMYSTTGVNTGPHILMESLAKVAGFKATHVPYGGSGPAAIACLGGHVDMVVTSGTAGQVGPGKLRVIAAVGDERSELLPDAPTLKELGYPLSLPMMQSLFAPKGTPKECIKKISDAYRKAVEENPGEMKKTLANTEQGLAFMDTETVTKTLQAAYQSIKKMLDDLGIKAK